MKLYLKIVAGLALLSVSGCASVQEGYTTRYGLTNPDYSLVSPTPADEAYPKNNVGQEYIEGYDRKYHEKGAVISPAASEGQAIE